MDKKRLLELAGMDEPDHAGMDMPPKEAGETGEMGEEDPVDTVSLDTPLFIRLLEWAREDSKNDMQLHKVAENLVALSQEGGSLSMENYDAAIEGTEDMNGDEEMAPMDDEMNSDEPMPRM
jgi:hypothetical protein